MILSFFSKIDLKIKLWSFEENLEQKKLFFFENMKKH
jgi:hypothetical protein